MIERDVFTVTQLSQYLKNLFWQDDQLQNLWISGEISNYKCHAPSGHIYFTLKDEQSVLRCVYFRKKNALLRFAPTEGMKVMVRGSISLYERSGYYQLYVEEMEPEGIGALFLAYEQLKAKLSQQGLFDERCKKPLPRVPRKVGLITSPSGAAIRDFLTTVKRRFPCVQILLYPVAVQGKEAPIQINNALQELDKRGLDVIVMTRGGGSLEELWCFNDEMVARSIFMLKTPFVSAIGHETDYTIADFVADKRASTPTAAAEMIAPEQSELLRYLNMQEQLMGSIVFKNMQKKRYLLEQNASSPALKHPREKINLGYQRVDELWPRLKRAMELCIRFKKTNLENSVENLEALNPLNVLTRGYTLVFDLEENRPLKSVRNVKQGQGLKISFHDGNAYCTVNKVERKEEDII